MCRGHDPLFWGHPALLSLPIYHHCAALMPPFSNFRKNFHFQPCFGQNFSSQDANFPNFRSLDPSFFKENPLPRPYFSKPVWHTSTKKKVECPPPPGCLSSWAKIFCGLSSKPNNCFEKISIQFVATWEKVHIQIPPTSYVGPILHSTIEDTMRVLCRYSDKRLRSYYVYMQ